MAHVISGICRAGRSTKQLVQRLRPGDIALISHVDLDDVAAQAVMSRGVTAVLNTRPSFSGRYPARGPKSLLEAGLTVVDFLGEDLLDMVVDGTPITIRGPMVLRSDRVLATGRIVTGELIAAELKAARVNLRVEFDRFMDNTLSAALKEKPLFMGKMNIPALHTVLTGRPVVIVVRGNWYREDLRTLASYIREQRPVLVGVDGGADALLARGLRPDIVIGDMDSVSDRALTTAGDVVVHAYRDGRAPGLQRVVDLGVPATTFACPGTSEDAAMLLAFEHDAELIVGVGTHRGLIDFLDKGRSGMASTLLVRMLVGPVLIDANGLSRLYRSGFGWSDVAMIASAGLLPLLAVLIRGPLAAGVARALLLRMKMMMWWG